MRAALIKLRTNFRDGTIEVSAGRPLATIRTMSKERYQETRGGRAEWDMGAVSVCAASLRELLIALGHEVEPFTEHLT